MSAYRSASAARMALSEACFGWDDVEALGHALGPSRDSSCSDRERAGLCRRFRVTQVLAPGASPADRAVLSRWRSHTTQTTTSSRGGWAMIEPS